MMGYRSLGQVVEVRMSVGRLLDGVSGELLPSVCLLVCESLRMCVSGREVLEESSQMCMCVCVWFMVYVESTGMVRRAWMTASAGRGSSGHAAGC